MSAIYYVILTFGILCAISSVGYYAPQFIKLFRTKKTSNISFLGLTFAIVSSIIWIIFGILIAAQASQEGSSNLQVVGYPIIVAYIIILAFEIPMLVIKIKNIKAAKRRQISEEDYCLLSKEEKKNG